MINFEVKEYNLENIAWFSKVNEKFGELSNMSNLGMTVNGVFFRNAEMLYQACRFTDNPEIQQEIINQKSPIAVKMKSKKYKKQGLTRTGFGDENETTEINNERIEIMRWCLRVKLAFNMDTFGRVLRDSQQKQIVEYAPKATHCFWDAFPTDKSKPNVLMGINVLGQLLEETRSLYLQKLQDRNTLDLFVVPAPKLNHFMLLGQQIIEIDNRPKKKS